jgi:hypothetical protein
MGEERILGTTLKSAAPAPNAGTGEHVEKVVGAVALVLYAVTILMYVLIATVPSTMP